jgi:hypothetical protein
MTYWQSSAHGHDMRLLLLAASVGIRSLGPVVRTLSLYSKNTEEVG